MSALTAREVMLDPETQAIFDRVRPLSDYRLQYVNGRYPLLSLLYAVYAGGEHTLFCDHYEAFVRAYVVESASPEERAAAEEKLASIKTLMKRLEDKRLVERERAPAQQDLLEPNDEEWRLLGHILAGELGQKDAPMPMW
jgi:hypothetical protein